MPKSVTGTIAAPLDSAAATLRGVAANHGYAVDEAATTPSELVFTKGMTLISWGSKLSILLNATADGGTLATIKPSETMAITDWGRGKRAAEKLLTEAGATLS